MSAPVSFSRGVTLYEDACRALAAVKSIGDAKDIHDKADAIRVFARQAKNRQLEIDAAEVRIRAERKLGELLANQKAVGQLHVGGRPRKTGGAGRPPTLVELGIDRKLSMRAQLLARQGPEDFERDLDRWRSKLQSNGVRVTARFRAESKAATDSAFRLIDGRDVRRLAYGQAQARIHALAEEQTYLERVVSSAGRPASTLVPFGDLLDEAQLRALRDGGGA